MTSPPRGTDASPFRLAAGLRDALADGYDTRALRADVAAGTVVGVVALPLSMALAIAVGVPPRAGLVTAIVGGAIVALLGGSRVQVTGPTAAFVVILAPIVDRFGLAGLALAGAMAGVILVGLGITRMGRLMEFVPSPVTAGFTAGIAVVIAVLQLRDFFGLPATVAGSEALPRLAAAVTALPGWDPVETGFGVGTLALLLLWPRLRIPVPAPLVALTAAALVAWGSASLAPTAVPETIASRFVTETPDGPVAGIPREVPLPLRPWDLPGPGGEPLVLDLALVRELLPAALAIALLGAIESLLSAVVADGMAGHRHDPSAELVALGVGNLVAPFFGGIAATGAIARTATNVRSGARSPIAAVVHSVVVLATMLLLAPLLGRIPMASLAALLLLVAWNMSEVRHLVRSLRTSPRSDVLVLLVCFGLTVVFDMVVAVLAGIVLASLLFMRRMAEVSGLELVDPEASEHPGLPVGVLEYRVAGPLFFGAAHRAIATLERVSDQTRVILLDLRAAPAIDATGLVSLSSALERLERRKVAVVLGGLRPQPLRALRRAGWVDRSGRLEVHEDWAAASARARELIAEPSSISSEP